MRRSTRFAIRAATALVSFVVVTAGMLALGGAIALAIDWDIPEGRELRGPTIVYDRNGDVLARLSESVEFRRVPLNKISPHLVRAVIATEDRRFYEHQGVDPVSVLRAIVSNVRFGGIRQGGSTLTQQYVKNVYVGNDESLYRKIREAVVAVQLEKERSKDQILESYLNHVYFGQGAYGAEAAARTYFGKRAAQLRPDEAATLASVLSAPSTANPVADRRGARRRRNVVLDEMQAAGFLAEPQARRWKKAPVRLVPRKRARPEFPYFVEEVRTQLLQAYGEERVYQGGLRVTTTLRPTRQRKLERAIRARLPSQRSLDAGVVAIDPATGDVMAAYSGRSFRRRQVDLAFGRGTDGRPSGSTFKMFALAAALEEGSSLGTSYAAPSSVTYGGWSVGGNGGCSSPCSLLTATALSSNTVFAQLANDVGARDFTQLARRVGVRQKFRKPDLPMVLGTADVTPLDMASAVATFANDGVACPARVVTEVRVGKRVLNPPDLRQPTARERAFFAKDLRSLGYDFDDEDLGRCYRAVAPSVARQVNKALEAVVAWGTGTAADINRPQAGKTGTTQANREVWFAGYTPQLAMAVSFYNVKRQTTLDGIPGCDGVCFGGTLAASMWRDAAAALLEGIPARRFPKLVPDERTIQEPPDRRRLGPSVGVGPIYHDEDETPQDDAADGEVLVEPSEDAPTEPGPAPSAGPPPQQQPPVEEEDPGDDEEQPEDPPDEDPDDDEDDEEDKGLFPPLPDPP